VDPEITHVEVAALLKDGMTRRQVAAVLDWVDNVYGTLGTRTVGGPGYQIDYIRLRSAQQPTIGYDHHEKEWVYDNLKGMQQTVQAGNGLDKHAASGLYGNTKRVESECLACTRKLARATAKVAKAVYTKDPKVAGFLAKHAKRKSHTAKLLVKALAEIGPRMAAHMAAAEKSAGRSYGLYGFPEKTARLGLSACADVRHEAGKIAYGLHSRRAAQHGTYNAFFQAHSKQGKCPYSRELYASYPDAPGVLVASGKPPATTVLVERGGAQTTVADYFWVAEKVLKQPNMGRALRILLGRTVGLEKALGGRHPTISALRGALNALRTKKNKTTRALALATLADARKLFDWSKPRVASAARVTKPPGMGHH